MDAIPVGKGASGENEALPRTLAVILFALAAIFGLFAAIGITAVPFSGQWRPLLVLAPLVPLVWGLVWLGRTLWSGRSIPTWFIKGFQIGVIAITVASLLFRGSWGEAAILLALILPTYLASWPGRRSAAKKPAGFHDLDELG